MTDDREEIPPEVHHYNHIGEVPWDIQKYVLLPTYVEGITDTDCSSYWAQRYKIFSRYDEGIWLTDDAWFGVTPEPVARFVSLYSAFGLELIQILQ